jgi:hypothetical protein
MTSRIPEVSRDCEAYGQFTDTMAGSHPNIYARERRRNESRGIYITTQVLAIGGRMKVIAP